MSFDKPSVLLLLFMLVPCAICLMRAERSRRRALAALVNVGLEDVVLSGRPQPTARAGLLIAAAMLTCVASAGPKAPAVATDTARSTRDILVIVDVSHSMAAEDIHPSRLGYARDTVRALLTRLDGERVGIIAFAGTAFLQCPLTRDFSAVVLLMDGLTPGVLPQQGTSLRQALGQAAGVLAKVPERAKVVIVMTDGEDHDADPQSAATRLAKMGTRMFVLGIGTETGAPIPLRDESGSLTGYKRDTHGRVVSTRLDWGRAQRVAQYANGSAFRADDPRSLESLLSEVTAVDSAPRAQGIQLSELLLILGAIVCVVLEGWIGLRTHGSSSRESSIGAE